MYNLFVFNAHNGLTILSLCMALTLLCAGCYTFNQIGTPGETPIEITNSEGKTAVAHFNKSKKVNHFLWGLVSPDNAGVEQLISDEVENQWRGESC